MKNLFKTITAISLTILTISCSKDSETPQATAPSAAAVYENNTVYNIPDATAIGGLATNCGINALSGIVVSPITINNVGIIKDPSKITVEIDIVHPFANDVVIELIAPSGESCGLLKRVYAKDDSNCQMSVDAKYVTGNKLSFNSLFTTALGTGPIATGNYKTTGPNTGTFPSVVPMISLNTFFTDKSIKGIWKLKGYDCSVADLGKINAWKLKFDTGALK